jgi:hypothetical protein
MGDNLEPMTSQQEPVFSPETRAVMTLFIANLIHPQSAYRIAKELDERSDDDLLKIMAVTNFYISHKLNPTIIGGLVSHDEDIDYIRLTAEHMETIDRLNLTLSDFNSLRLSLERLGLMPRGASSFPALKQHLEIEELSFMSTKRYYHNDALMVFVHENIDRHAEITQYMSDHKTQDVGKLRGYFCGETPALTEGVI